MGVVSANRKYSRGASWLTQSYLDGKSREPPAVASPSVESHVTCHTYSLDPCCVQGSVLSFLATAVKYTSPHGASVPLGRPPVSHRAKAWLLLCQGRRVMQGGCSEGVTVTQDAHITVAGLPAKRPKQKHFCGCLPAERAKACPG
jgi:hypothetical protein